jgi:tetratricopeptide (TPR) repeat protein
LGDGSGSQRVFFQYSLEKRWEAKLQRELIKVKSNGHLIHSYVFVTPLNVTGAKKDALAARVKSEFGWHLEIFDREWLHHQLEEVHPGLADKYIGSTGTTAKSADTLDPLPPLEEPAAISAWSLVTAQRYEEAIPRIRQLIAEPGTAPIDQAWAALAWCYYGLYNYRDAMPCIERAVELSPESIRHQAIKGCILCEYGSATESRPMPVAARKIFEKCVESSSDYGAFYNLGNVLSALGDYQAAVDSYIEAINFNDKVAEVWKNLGTCYFHLENHAREFECYEAALKLNPRLAHALISKANTTARVFQNYEEALRLLGEASAADPDVARHWPHFYWWRSFYLAQLGRLTDALASADDGLRSDPSHQRLLDLKAGLLSELWRRDSFHVTGAREFFRFRVKADPCDVRSLIELTDLTALDGDHPGAYQHIRRIIEHLHPQARPLTVDELEKSFTLDDLRFFSRNVGEYLTYRKRRPVEAFEELFSEGDHGSRYLWLVLGLSYMRVHSFEGDLGLEDDLTRFFGWVRESTSAAISKVSELTAKEYVEASVETKTKILSLLLISLAEVGFYEGCWLSGYIPSIRNVDNEMFLATNERFIQEHDLNPWRLDGIDAILKPVNDVWCLFPERSDTGGEDPS